MSSQAFHIDDYIDKKNRLDVRSLFIINSCVSLIMLKTADFTFITAAFLISLIIMLMFDMYSTACKYILTFIICIFLSRLAFIETTTALLHTIVSFLGFIGFTNIKILSFIMIAHVIIKKVHSTELIYALRKMKLHKGFILSLTVALRFLPTAKKELTLIKECMQMRGIETSVRVFLKNPLSLIEYSLVPLLFRSVKISEEMTAAALVKGVEYNGTKTSLVEVQFSKADVFMLIFSAGLLSFTYFYSTSISSFFTASKDFLYQLIYKVLT